MRDVRVAGFRGKPRRAIVAVGLFVLAVACKEREVAVATGEVDNLAARGFKTFAIMAPVPLADTVAAVVTNDSNRAVGAVMDMDPMLSTSLVGRAIRTDLSSAFVKRGYQAVEGNPDFLVAYYAGTGRVVDTRAAEKRYRTGGQQVTTQTTEFPAGTIVVDVIDARSDSLVWRGTGVTQIPSKPDEYARALADVVDGIVGTFPRAKR